MRVGSLFSGIGGFDLGFERAGMECAWMVEYDKQARSVLRTHWPDVPHYEDIHDVGRSLRPIQHEPRDRNMPDAKERERGVSSNGQSTEGEDVHDVRGQRDTISRRGRWKPVYGESDKEVHARGPAATHAPVDVICGGFPCQDYSVAGKRGGLVGDRGALWWQMHRIIAECRSEWVVGENVPGLLSSNGGADFLAIIQSLVQLGYGVTWATLDSQYFGVAQRRRRLFIVGHSGGISRPEILALSEGLCGHPAPSREAGEGTAGSVEPGASGCEVTGIDTYNASLSGGVSIPVRASAGQRPIDGPRIAFTSESVHQDGTHHPLRVNGSAAIAGESTPRRLTPVECERLQGFPDDWTRYYHDGKQVADGPRYRMMGNAVTVNVAEWIGRRLMAMSPIPSEGETS